MSEETRDGQRSGPAARPADPSGRRVLGFLLHLAVAAYGALLGLVLMYRAAFRCDESCDPSAGGGWRYDETSWVWEVVGAGGLVLVVLAVAVVVAVSVRAVRGSAWVPAAAIAVLVALAPLVPPDSSVPDALPLGEALAAVVALTVYGGWRLTREHGSAALGLHAP